MAYIRYDVPKNVSMKEKKELYDHIRKLVGNSIDWSSDMSVHYFNGTAVTLHGNGASFLGGYAIGEVDQNMDTINKLGLEKFVVEDKE